MPACLMIGISTGVMIEDGRRHVHRSADEDDQAHDCEQQERLVVHQRLDEPARSPGTSATVISQAETAAQATRNITIAVIFAAATKT